MFSRTGQLIKDCFEVDHTPGKPPFPTYCWLKTMEHTKAIFRYSNIRFLLTVSVHTVRRCFSALYLPPEAALGPLGLEGVNETMRSTNGSTS